MYRISDPHPLPQPPSPSSNFNITHHSISPQAPSQNQRIQYVSLDLILQQRIYSTPPHYHPQSSSLQSLNYNRYRLCAPYRQEKPPAHSISPRSWYIYSQLDLPFIERIDSNSDADLYGYGHGDFTPRKEEKRAQESETKSESRQFCEHLGVKTKCWGTESTPTPHRKDIIYILINKKEYPCIYWELLPKFPRFSSDARPWYAEMEVHIFARIIHLIFVYFNSALIAIKNHPWLEVDKRNVFGIKKIGNGILMKTFQDWMTA